MARRTAQSTGAPARAAHGELTLEVAAPLASIDSLTEFWPKGEEIDTVFDGGKDGEIPTAEAAGATAR